MRKYEILLALSQEDPGRLEAIALALEGWGYQVMTAVDSSSAGEALRARDFDLVITDLLDILKKAKEIHPETTVVILSDTCKVTFAIKALRLHADDYILKPLNPIELRNLVAHSLRKLELKPQDYQLKAYEGTLNEKILNLLKMMSHDIRGSLVSLSATLKLLTRGYYGRMDEGVEGSLEEMLSKLIRLTGMTEEYLCRTFSVNGDLEARHETLDLVQDIIGPVLDELSSEVKSHAIRIDQCFDVMSIKRIPVAANGMWLKTVFRNLLRNAIKYGDQGGTIAVGFQDHGSFYRLNVYNSGKPIPEEWRDKIFTKFMSLGNNGNGGTGGMGLGLYLVREIIRRYGGEIWYEAEEGGSNFIFTLPSGLAFSDSVFPIGRAQPRLAAEG